jgi:hypothetical protein
MRLIIPLIFTFYLVINFYGCLAVETKEYSFKLKRGYSGEGSIKYINIMRTLDTNVTIEDDYNELMDSYLNGNKPEDEMTGVKNVSKRLYEEENQLCGEIRFEFDDIRDLRFYNYKNLVWAYFINSTSMFGAENYFSSNGTFGEQDMPVIFWDGSQKEFKFKTTLTQPSETTESLLQIWRERGNR